MGSGLQGSLSVGPLESAYGTFQSPTRAWEAQTAKPSLTEVRKQGGGLAGGRFGDLGGRNVRIRSAGTGTATLECVNLGCGLLFARALGSVAAPVAQSSPTALLQTHVGSYAVQSDTLQFGVPLVESATVEPYDLLGAVMTQLDYTCQVDDELMLTPTWDAQAVSESNGLVAPVYPTAASVRPFHFGQLTVSAGVFGSESATPVKGVAGTIQRPMNVGRVYSGSPLKRIPVVNGQPQMTGSLTVDFIDKTALADHWANGTPFSLIQQWTGSIIATTFHEQVTISYPQVFLTGDTPGLDGEDIVSGSFPWVAKSDGTNPIVTVLYQSTDTAT